MAIKFAEGRGRTPFFKENDEKQIYSSLNGNSECEILIIGGGLTGLFAAYYFHKAGKNVCIVDKSVIGGASSRYMPPIIQYDADVNLEYLRIVYGQENALYIYREFRKAIIEINQICKEISSNCGLKIMECCLFSSRENKTEIIENEYRLRKYAGFDVEILDKKDALEMFSFPVTRGIYSKDLAAEADFVRLSKDLAAYLTVKGVQLYENTEMTSLVEKQDGTYYSETSEGLRIEAKAVCDCRGASLINRYPQMGRLQTTFSAVTQPISNFRGWQNHCILKDDYKNALFLSTTADERIVISGYDSKLIRSNGMIWGVDPGFYLKSRYNCLEETLEEMFFGIDNLSVEFNFCGAYIKTHTKLPVITADKTGKNLFYACCGNKNLLIGSIIAGKALCSLYGAEALINAELFNPD